MIGYQLELKPSIICHTPILSHLVPMQRRHSLILYNALAVHSGTQLFTGPADLLYSCTIRLSVGRYPDRMTTPLVLSYTYICFPVHTEISAITASPNCSGMDQLFLGRFVFEWRDLHSQYLTSKQRAPRPILARLGYMVSLGYSGQIYLSTGKSKIKPNTALINAQEKLLKLTYSSRNTRTLCHSTQSIAPG